MKIFGFLKKKFQNKKKVNVLYYIQFRFIKKIGHFLYLSSEKCIFLLSIFFKMLTKSYSILQINISKIFCISKYIMKYYMNFNNSIT